MKRIKTQAELFELLDALPWVGLIDMARDGSDELAVLTEFQGIADHREYDLQRYLDGKVGPIFAVRLDPYERALIIESM